MNTTYDQCDFINFLIALQNISRILQLKTHSVKSMLFYVKLYCKFYDYFGATIFL